jgi:DNA-binding XRE family transcriptional regulator
LFPRSLTDRQPVYGYSQFDSERAVADKIPTGRMIRAARGLLGMEQRDLASEAGVDRRTIARLEAETDPSSNPLRVWTYERVRDVLKKRGIIFLYPNKSHGEGVTLKN